MADTKYFAVPQGKVFIATRNATGLTSGFVHIGDCDGFTVNAAQQYLDIYESMSGNRGIAAHIPTQSDYSVEVSMLNIDGDNLARAFYGEASEVAGASVLNEAIIGYAGQMAPLKYPGVSSVVVKNGATTLVAGTDYVLDAENGSIHFADTAALDEDGTALSVSYTHAGVAARTQLFTQGLKDYCLRFEGKSKFDDLVQIGMVHRVAMNMAQTLSLIGTGVNKLTVGGKLLPAMDQPAGESQYFTYVQK